jgi:hypothetical protein
MRRNKSRKENIPRGKSFLGMLERTFPDKEPEPVEISKIAKTAKERPDRAGPSKRRKAKPTSNGHSALAAMPPSESP